jgi:hypothetical protein
MKPNFKTSEMWEKERKIERAIKNLMGGRYAYLNCYVFLDGYDLCNLGATTIDMYYDEQNERKMFSRVYDFEITNKMDVVEVAQMFFIEFIFGVE